MKKKNKKNLLREMKTFFVVYVNKPMTVDDANVGRKDKYSFNTEADIKVGDLLESDKYSTPMLVTDILDKAYKYVNVQTGDLSDEPTSTKCYPIRTMVISASKDKNTVYANHVGE